MIRRFFVVVICVFFIYGCGSNSSKNTISKKWVDSGIGGFSNVSLYVPTKKSPIGSGRSLMIVLHGCVQQAVDLKSANLDKVAEQYGMVIALPDSDNSIGYGCWDYLDSNRKRTKGDHENILLLVKDLLANDLLAIDKDQVYISGLSSGGVFSMIMGCMAPDVFAGTGVFAAPSGGVETVEAAMKLQSDMDAAAADCIQYSSGYTDAFSTQLFVVAHGDGDTIVNFEYLDVNADAMAKVYGLSVNKTHSKAILPKVNETIYGKGRVAKLALNGAGHEWAGGKGAWGSFVDGGDFNYGRYLADFFLMNNLRVK